MGLTRTAIGRADALLQLVSAEQASGLDHPFLPAQPLGLMTPILRHLLSVKTNKSTALRTSAYRGGGPGPARAGATRNVAAVASRRA